MPAPENTFKVALAAGQRQIGCWLSLSSPSSAEIVGSAGFDWALIDAEHAPNGIPEILAQLRALNGRAAHPVVRVPIGEAWILKQVLDLGVQSVLVPMVNSAAEAARMVRAVRYPPEGIRGLGSALARASDYNAVPDYPATANREICLIVQAESRAAIDDIDAIAATDGVDAVFIGPADLAADMGHLGNPGAPEVVEAIRHALGRIAAAGKAPGILAFDLATAARYAEAGARLVAVGSDLTSLAKGVRGLAAEARQALG
jgi:4-hydroxy-2-oxoheptanedioate aldolase